MNGWALQEPGDEPSPFLLSPQPVVGPVSVAPPPSFEEELEELPDTYGTQALYLTACDPGRVFAYWDIDWSKFHPGDSVRLRIVRPDGGIESEALITLKDSGHFADVQEPGGTYFAEIGTFGPLGWETLARSGLVTLPPPGPAAPELPASFATIPFEQTFAQMQQVLAPFARRPEEGVAEIVARLQQDWVTHGALPLDQLSVEQRSSLESVLQPAGYRLGGDGVPWPFAFDGGEAGGSSSDFGPALAALRALIEGAGPAARGGLGDASSHAPGSLEFLLEWDLWQRTWHAQQPEGRPADSAPSSLSHLVGSDSGGL